MGSILQVRTSISHQRSKEIRVYERIVFLLFTFTFTAVLCSSMKDTSLNNFETYDGETRRNMEILEPPPMSVTTNYPRRHVYSIINKKKQEKPDAFHSSLKKISSQKEIKTGGLNEILIQGTEVTVHEKNPSPDFRYDAQSLQPWPNKSEQAERRNTAGGHRLDGSTKTSPMNRISSASIDKRLAKSHRTHKPTHSLIFRNFLTTKREEEALIPLDSLVKRQEPLDNIIENEILWGPRAEELVPQGLESDAWSTKARLYSILNVTCGCGRMQNRLVITEDGTKMCARYRMNQDQIQGEVFSYYLSKVLGIQNAPPLVLSTVDYESPQWRSVRGQIQDAGWTDGKLVILSQWVPDLIPVYVPIEFHDERKQLHPINIVNKTYTEISELVQWSDMVIFDYLTANLDRLTNNMFNKQWNNLIMDSPVHNLAKSKQSGLLIFFDNESGLLHSYRLLDKFGKFHQEILQSLCIFRANTVSIIEKLYHDDNISAMIKAEYESNEPLHTRLFGLPHRNIEILKQRLADVYKQIQFCRRKFDTPADV
ncbi:four-jointed box protein 1-like [Anneissia japonica]|uniref:four-jointed box protein 1-like n=1 Tax=Anneissia japonica TaxID=1529436 RepID=UPI0014259360|nr:four-jointed box protein 1-like [Anneissia japonica]